MLNKNIVLIFGFAFVALTFGCLEASDVNLYEEGVPEVVVEGRITDAQPPYYVRVSTSADPMDQADSKPISNAQVFLSDNEGNRDELKYKSNGVYVANNINGKIGQQYFLEVLVDTSVYKATDSIKPAPRIDSVRPEFFKEPDRDPGYYLVFYIQNKTNTSNYYKIELTVNDSLYNGYYDLLYVEDILGQTAQTSILPYQFHRLDTVITKVHSITETMYEYYRGLNKQVDNLYGNVQPPMLNPPNNITGALGYFQASSLWQDTTIIE